MVGGPRVAPGGSDLVPHVGTRTPEGSARSWGTLRRWPMYSRLAELDARVRHRLADLLGEALDVPLDDALLGQVFLVGLLYEALF
jgi:hypothetical protein